jgi:tetratricopeptide (TPR) repeat protein
MNGRALLPVIAVMAITLLATWAAIDAPFIYDEQAGIVENRAIRPGSQISDALGYRFSPDQVRPVFFLSLLLDARLFGMEPRPFRVTSLLLHLAGGLLVWLLLRRLTARGGVALAGMTLFLLHPLQSESILYIWGRSGILSTLFLITSVFLALRAADTGSSARRIALWGISLTACTLGLLSKEEAIVLPIIFLIWWTLVEDRPVVDGLRRAALLSLPILLFLPLRWLMLGAIGRQVFARGLLENFLGQAMVTLRTIRLIFIPVGQSVDPEASVPSPVLGLLALCACAAIGAGAVVLAWRSRTSSARRFIGSLPARQIAGGTLIAAAGVLIYWLVPLPDLMSERRVYLPLFGASVVLAGLLHATPTTSRRAGMTGSVATLLLILLLAPTLHARARVWSDPQRLWEEAARIGPRRIRPYINLGVLAGERGETEEAAELFDRAVALDPTHHEALFNRARLRMDAGDLQGALVDLETALIAKPGMVKARINLGIVRIRLGDLAGAEVDLRDALLIDPAEPRALSNLAEVLRATGRTAEAKPLYLEALAADPSYAYAAVRLGVALEAEGDIAGALRAYREYLERGPATPADRQAVIDKIAALENAASTPPYGAPPPGEEPPP